MLRKTRSTQAGRGEAGFTLAEILVSLIVFSQVILMSLLLFDFNNRVTRVQTRVAEMQQSLRVGHGEIIRMVRLAGRSGLPVTAPTGPIASTSFPPATVAVSVLNNVNGPNRRVVPSLADSPLAIQGSDILVLRGNFSGQFYRAQMDTLTPNDRATATTGTLVVSENAAIVNRAGFNFPLPENDLGTVAQDLTELREANDPTLRGADASAVIPEAIVLISSTPGVNYSVLELVPSVAGNATAGQVTLNFRIKGSGTELVDDYRALGTNDPNALFPLAPGSGCYVAILEEYRFYVRNDGGATPETARPVLSRARLLPGTSSAYGPVGTTPDDLVLRTDIGDQVLDLQVALGFDTVTQGQIGRAGVGVINEAPDDTADDWLYNRPADDPTDAAFTVFTEELIPRLYFVRVNTLARTAGPDREGEEPLIPRLEDRPYPQTSGLVNTPTARKYRRRSLQTTVDLRNL